MQVKLIYKYLEYDIEQITHRYASARITDAEIKDMAQIDNSTSDSNLSLRYCITGVAKLKKILKDYIENGTNDSDDKLNATDSWTFKFNEAIADSNALAGLMHWFVVKFATAEWAKTYSPNDTSAANKDLNDCADELDELLSESEMPMKERRTEYLEDDMIIEVTAQYSQKTGFE